MGCRVCNRELTSGDINGLCYSCTKFFEKPQIINRAVYSLWAKQKPVLDRECILLTLSFLDNGIPTIRVFSIYEQIINTEELGGAYWGIFENGDEEWGDYDELEAEYYLILDYPERSET